MSRDYLIAILVPNRECVDGATRARPQQVLASNRVGSYEYGDVVGVEREGLRRRGDAVAEANAECAIDAHAQSTGDALVVLGHATSPRGPALREHNPSRQV